MPGSSACIHPDDRAAAEQGVAETASRRTDRSISSSAPPTADHRLRVRGKVFAGDGAPAEANGILIEFGPPYRRRGDEQPAGRDRHVLGRCDHRQDARRHHHRLEQRRRSDLRLHRRGDDRQPLSMLLPPGQEDEMADMLERIKAGERVEHYETRRRRKDGEIIDVSLTVSPVWDDARAPDRGVQGGARHHRHETRPGRTARSARRICGRCWIRSRTR